MHGPIRHFAVVLCVSWALTPAMASAAPSPLDSWSWRHPLPPGNELQTVAFGLNTFAAVGDQTLLTSLDGLNWTATISQDFQGLKTIVANDQLWVAASVDGRILVSSDTLTWLTAPNPSEARWQGAAYGGTTFVAVGTNPMGQGGPIVASPNGLSWEDRSPGTQRPLRAVAYGAQRFVGVGDHHTLLYSPDGRDWHTRIPISGSADLHAVAYGQGHFVVVGESSTILHSADGVYWHRAESPVVASLNSVLFAEGQFIAAGDDGTLLRSTDAVSWSQVPLGLADDWVGLAYGEGRFVAVGRSVTVATSTDGLQWNQLGSPHREALTAVAHAADRFVAVGQRGLILHSTDGITWTAAEHVTQEDLSDVTFGTGRFVAVGRSGVILSSTDGHTWETHASNSTAWLRSVTYNGERLVVVAALGEALVSTDAHTWTRVLAGDNLLLSHVAGGLGSPNFVAVGPLDVLISADGLTWTPVAKPTSERWNGVAYGQGQFLAVGDEGGIFLSSDGNDWQLKTALPVQPYGVIWTHDRFLVTTPDGLLSSADGVSWSSHATVTSRSLADFAFGNHTFVAVGEFATILQSATVPDDPSQVSLSALGWNALDGASFLLQGPAETTVRVEATTNFSQWLDLGPVTLAPAATPFRDPEALTYPPRFYRARVIPPLAP